MPELHSISFIWPRLLWLLLAVPVLALMYALWVWYQSRRPSGWSGATRAASGSGAAAGVWQRTLTLSFVAIGLSLLLLALARPRAILLLPGWSDSVMLVMDSSGSMRADDIKPSRIEAAQAAALSFIDAQPPQVRVGVVSAAGAAAIVQAPTDDRDALRKAIEGLSLQRGSALGSGIVIALSALLPGAGIDVQALLNEEERPRPGSGAGGSTGAGAGMAAGAASALPRAQKKERPPPVAPGSNKATAIILLSDGQSNFGPDMIKMAELAASYGVRVFTVGMGTPQGVILKANGMSMRVRLDEAALEKVASITRADYFRATSQNELARIYGTLSKSMSLQKHQLTEISALVALFGMLWIIAASAWSIWRHGRVI